MFAFIPTDKCSPQSSTKKLLSQQMETDTENTTNQHTDIWNPVLIDLQFNFCTEGPGTFEEEKGGKIV